jgi:hypothetical protein
VKLLAAVLCCATTCAAVFAAISSRPRPPTPSALELCLAGGVELIDERCAAAGGCAKQSVRLAWERGQGVLFEGDSTGEREQRRLDARELAPLLRTLSRLEPASTDSDLQCGTFGCPAAERVLTITTNCGSTDRTFTFMRGRPAWERVRSACTCTEGAELARCTAQGAWHAAFATTLAARFGTVFRRLRESARGG